MPGWIYGPITLLLMLWAALGVIGVKGFLFHRQPRPPQLPDETYEEEFGNDQGVGLACWLCLLFLFWPLALASKIDEWLPPPKGGGS